MACRPFAFVLVVAATVLACAGGEETTQNSGFAAGPTSMPPPSGSQSGTSDPTGGADTEPIRPDMGDGGSGGLSSGGDPGGTSTTTTTTTSTTDPGSTSAPAQQCGDGVIEGTEECEGADLNGETCMSFGFNGGTLICSACLFDKTNCFSESCGDGMKNGGEECDCGQQGQNCSAAQLGNAACTGLPAPNGGNYHGGTLACGSPQSCVFNKTQCTYCGDGKRNGPEACEGGDLGGATCQSLGFSGGTLTCSASCTHNTAGCQQIVCGNGQCQQGEDSCNCPGDCPDDPNSCSPCQCGGDGGNCYCDDSCLIFLDCCGNGPC